MGFNSGFKGLINVWGTTKDSILEQYVRGTLLKYFLVFLFKKCLFLNFAFSTFIGTFLAFVFVLSSITLRKRPCCVIRAKWWLHADNCYHGCLGHGLACIAQVTILLTIIITNCKSWSNEVCSGLLLKEDSLCMLVCSKKAVVCRMVSCLYAF